MFNVMFKLMNNAAVSEIWRKNLINHFKRLTLKL